MLAVDEDDTRRRAAELVALGDAWFAAKGAGRIDRALDAAVLLSAATHFLRDLVAGQQPRPLLGLDMPVRWRCLTEPRPNPPQWPEPLDYTAPGVQALIDEARER